MQSEVTNRRLGIELEMVAPILGHADNFQVQELIANILCRQGIRAVARSYSHAPVPDGYDFCVEHDSSLRDETRYQGIRWARLEVKNRPMTFAEVEGVLPSALELLRYLGCRVNSSTAFHNHVDLSDAVDRPAIARNLAHLVYRYQNVLFGLVAPSRKNNHYCQALTSTDARRFDRVQSFQQLSREASRSERFKMVNFANLANGRNTVEFRSHGGTLDWEKIKSWVLLNQRLVTHAAKRNCHFGEPIENNRAGLNGLLVCIGLKPNSRIYKSVPKDLRQVGKLLVKRWKTFNTPRDFKSSEAAA